MPMRPPVHMAAGARTPEEAKAASKRYHDAQRRRGSPWRLWYGLAAWKAARLAQLALQPLCERHLARDQVVPATVVNHRRPHRGDWGLFIDPENHESVCKACHDGEIQREEAQLRASEKRFK